MRFTYDFIKENLKIYNQAKDSISAISDYENSLISYNSMRTLGLEKFAEFYNFIKRESDYGFDLIKPLKIKELKSIIVSNTTIDRFKTYISRRTGPQFIKLISEDSETFDRLLNGRWSSKPSYRRRGRRMNEKISGLDICFVPIMNWIISNNIDTCELESSYFKSFSKQEAYSYRIKWYTKIELSIENIPKKEIDVTFNLLNSLVNFISQSEIDFRKLNSDFITESVQSYVKKLMIVPKGTYIKSLVDLDKQLTKDKTYKVEDCIISYGFVKVWIMSDSGYRNYYEYKLFEDVSLQRDMLLKQLGILD